MKRIPEWTKNKIIYEVNLRQYSQGGSIKEFEAHLPRLKKLGVDILWFMPIHPIGIKNRKGDMGSYYSVQNYKAVDKTYGTLEDFKNLVDTIHNMDMYVLLDWVANHTSWDHQWTSQHPEFYTQTDDGGFKAPFPEWEDVIHLNYNSSELWKEMIDSMKFWIKEADIDGFRCDMAHLVRTPFWNEARRQLDEIKPVFMLAESENRDLLDHAFDALYNWNIFHKINDIAQGRTTLHSLKNCIENELQNYRKGTYELLFTSNHDENSWNGSAIERLTFSLEVCNVLCFTLPGIPLIYSGQEAGNYQKLSFFTKNHIDWKHDKMTPFYQHLCEIKHRNPALWNGDFGGKYSIVANNCEEHIYSFTRQKENDQIIVLCNFSPDHQLVILQSDSNVIQFRDLFSYKFVNLKENLHVEPWGYRILEKVN